MDAHVLALMVLFIQAESSSPQLDVSNHKGRRLPRKGAVDIVGVVLQRWDVQQGIYRS